MNKFLKQFPLSIGHSLERLLIVPENNPIGTKPSSNSISKGGGEMSITSRPKRECTTVGTGNKR